MNRNYIFAGAAVLTAAAIGVAAYLYFKKSSAEETDPSDEIPVAYSYDEALQKAKEKIAAGDKDDRVKLVPAIDWITSVNAQDIKNYNSIASEYDTESEIDPDDIPTEDSDTDDGVSDNADWPVADDAENAVIAEENYIPIHDEDLGKFYRISEDKYRFENLSEYAKVTGIYNAKGHALMLDKLGMYTPETELFRRVATIVDEGEEEYADALYFTCPTKKMDVKVIIDLG